MSAAKLVSRLVFIDREQLHTKDLTLPFTTCLLSNEAMFDVRTRPVECDLAGRCLQP